MKIIVAGAGELGRLLALNLSKNSHDVVIVDSSPDILEHITEKLDVRVLEGSCVSVPVLKDAGVDAADALLAVSGDDPANIVACQLAKKFGVRKTVCRVNGEDCFSEPDGITPESLGIWKSVSPPDECVRKICGVIRNRNIKEEIRFSNPNAVITVYEITRSSFLTGTRLKDIPTESGLLESIRFAAIVREKKLIIPHGDTLLVPGDKVYIAGREHNVSEFIRWASADGDDVQSCRVVVSGATSTGIRLAKRLISEGHDVRFIEKDRRLGEKLMDELESDLLVINGDPTDEEALEEAGVTRADAFIGASERDEDNILGCLIAKRMGARKTITLTYKPEYIRIVPTMESIDCGFNSTLAAVNSILRILETRIIRVDAFLQLFNAHLREYRVLSSSPLAGKPLAQSRLPASAVLALIFRRDDVMAPSGQTALQTGDTVVAITTPEIENALARFFPEK